MAQGAAQATEDAAMLAAALREHSSLKQALKAYESRRKPRAAYIARNTRVLQDWLHLYDGAERDLRDQMMKTDHGRNPMFWGSSARNDWLFGHDASELSNDAGTPALPPRPSAADSVYRRQTGVT